MWQKNSLKYKFCLKGQQTSWFRQRAGRRRRQFKAKINKTSSVSCYCPTIELFIKNPNWGEQYSLSDPGTIIAYRVFHNTVKSHTRRIWPLFHLKWFSQLFLDSILWDILIFWCSRPFRYSGREGTLKNLRRAQAPTIFFAVVERRWSW